MNKFAIVHYMTEAVTEKKETAVKIVEWFEQPAVKATAYIVVTAVALGLVLFGLIKAKKKHWK